MRRDVCGIPERLHELNLPSTERHFLRATLNRVHKLFHGYVTTSAEEFFKPPAAEGTTTKVRQPHFDLARSKAAFAVRSFRPWTRLPPHTTEAPTRIAWMPTGAPSSLTLVDPAPLVVLMLMIFARK